MESSCSYGHSTISGVGVTARGCCCACDCGLSFLSVHGWQTLGLCRLTNQWVQFGQGRWENWHWKGSEAEGAEGVGNTPGGLKKRWEGKGKKKNEHKALFKSIQRSFTDFPSDSSHLCFWREMLANSQNTLGTNLCCWVNDEILEACTHRCPWYGYNHQWWRIIHFHPVLMNRQWKSSKRLCCLVIISV